MKNFPTKLAITAALSLQGLAAMAGTYSVGSVDISLLTWSGDWSVTTGSGTVTYSVNDGLTNFGGPPNGEPLTKTLNGGVVQGTVTWHVGYSPTGPGDVPSSSCHLNGNGHCAAYASMPPVGATNEGNSTTTVSGDYFISTFQLEQTSVGSTTNSGYSTSDHSLGSIPDGVSWTQNPDGSWSGTVSASINVGDTFSETSIEETTTEGAVNFKDTLSITF